jgi:mono/diheme cytochrome c family protein
MTVGPAAVVGIFPNAEALVRAVAKIRPDCLGRLEAYTPYPVHGLDRALGLKRSWLGGAVLAMGTLGATAAIAFEWWTSAVDYPIPTGGKPIFSWQAFVPIMFELTVLLATFTAGLGMLFLANKLMSFGHPMLASQAIKMTTRDKFALAIEAASQALDAKAQSKILLDAGAESVEVLRAPDLAPGLSLGAIARIAGAVMLACAAAGGGMYAAVKLYPVLPPMVHMHDQPRRAAFRDMQQPVAGTVARGHLPPAFDTPERAGTMLTSPLARSRATLEKGRIVYANHCAVCHGMTGDGVAMLSAAYGAKPGNFHTAAVRAYPDGQIYGVIVLGKNAMPNYAADLDEDERWAAVGYVRALERAENATDEDVK